MSGVGGQGEVTDLVGPRRWELNGLALAEKRIQLRAGRGAGEADQQVDGLGGHRGHHQRPRAVRGLSAAQVTQRLWNFPGRSTRR
jgi:hypothetical protein